MPTSNATRGAYYKARSKKWLEMQGRTTFDMEINRTVWTPRGPVSTKRDQLGADLGYLAADCVVFLQIKSGAKPTGTLHRMATEAFAAFTWPTHSRREVHVWRAGARSPEVLPCP